MKRKGYIIEEIITDENLYDAFYYVLRGRRGKTESGRRLMKNREKVIANIRRSIADGSYGPSSYHEFQICENGKTRTIQSVSKYDRIALNAIMRVVEQHLNRTFIADSASSIKGRGCHYLHKRIRHAIMSQPESRYVYKCDIHHYYDSIPQEAVMEVFKRRFKDARLIAILERCVKLLPHGISIGLRPSQVLGNLYLDYHLDHVLKDNEGVDNYRRYCDDEETRADSYYELTRRARIMHSRVEAAGLTIKPSEQMWSLDDRPLDFLGWVTYGDGRVRVRKHIKQRFARRWGRVKSKRRKRELIGSFYGIAKHAQARHLFKTITGYNMKDYKDLGFKYVTADGKKQFDVRLYQISELNNESIIVKDFEVDVPTSQGDNRTLVLFQSETLGDGKFFTSSKELRAALEFAASGNEIPFRATIKKKEIGKNKFKFIFV